MAGLYIHIPFCKQACHYCDFHFSTNLSKQDEMVSAIVRELEIQQDYLTEDSLNSIYFGGGTPSLLSENQFSQILNAISGRFRLNSSCEVTVEANPDDLSISKLTVLYSLGVNRLSIGIQSFDNHILKFLNRAHTEHQAIDCLEASREAGFKNISIDLIYAIPGQSISTLKSNVSRTFDFSPEHISCYGLTIEERTVFGNWLAKKKFQPVDESENAAQLEWLMQEFSDAGYEQYEISNFCKPGYYSIHNSSYWKQEPYLGLGPGAHSYDRESRQFNIKNNAKYLTAIHQGNVPYEKELLTLENKINEFLFTTLRTQWGCDTEKLEHLYNYTLMKEKQDQIDQLISAGLMIAENHILKLTHRGKLLADQISLDMMV